MVLKPAGFCSGETPEFENDVKMYGTQTGQVPYYKGKGLRMM